MGQAQIREEHGEKLKPVEGSFFMVDKNMVYKHGMEIAMYMTNLLEKYIYFEQKFPQYKGRFFLTYSDQAKQLNTTEHMLRKYKQYAKRQGWLITRLKGSPAKEWYELKLEHTDIQSAIKIIKGLAIKNVKDKPLKSLRAYKDTKDKDNRDKDIIMQNNNSLDSSSSNGKDSSHGKKIEPGMFEQIYNLYPRKENKAAAKKAFVELCQREDRPTLQRIRTRIKKHTRSDKWRNPKVPLNGKPTDMRPGLKRWLEDKMYLMEPDNLPTIYSPAKKDESRPNTIGHRDKNEDGSYRQFKEFDDEI